MLTGSSYPPALLTLDRYSLTLITTRLRQDANYYLVEVLGNLSTWQHPVIILKDIKYQELSGIVEFIYHGEVSIDQDCLPGFLHAAESLRIKGLTQDKKVGCRGVECCYIGVFYRTKKTQIK